MTVAWSAPSGDAVRAFAAMSMDGGVTFGPPQQIDPDRGGNQFNPRLAATAGGRVDVAYLWDPAGTGVVSATTASAAPPLPGATTEAWGNPVTRPGRRHLDGDRSASARLGIATRQRDQPAARDRRRLHGHVVGKPGRARGRPAPRDDRAGHRQLQTVTGSKNITDDRARRRRIDADGDPLTWSVGAQPTTPARA